MGLNVTLVMPRRCCGLSTSCPVVASQTLTVQPARIRPGSDPFAVGAEGHATVASTKAVRARTSLPEAASQIRTFASWPAEARRLPSGLTQGRSLPARALCR